MKIVTFGEVLMRLTPSDNLRLTQAGKLDFCFGGSEANFAVAMARYGHNVTHVTKLPDNAFGQAAFDTLRHYGVDTSAIVFGGNRLGAYLAEKGYAPCERICTYDRASSAMAQAKTSDFDWEKILSGADLFHFSGITPALSSELAAACLDACVTAQKLGVAISCDINYRSKLWSLDMAQKVMQPLCRYADFLFINESEAQVLGFPLLSADMVNDESLLDISDHLQSNGYHPHLLISVARITGAAGLDIKAKCCDGQKRELYESSRFPLVNIIDSIGAGDAFAAAFLSSLNIHAVLFAESELKTALDYAAAACAISHSVQGDFNLALPQEINRLAASGLAEGVNR